MSVQNLMEQEHALQLLEQREKEQPAVSFDDSDLFADAYDRRNGRFASPAELLASRDSGMSNDAIAAKFGYANARSVSWAVGKARKIFGMPAPYSARVCVPAADLVAARDSGMTYAAIAAKFGYSTSAAVCKAVARARKRIRAGSKHQ